MESSGSTLQVVSFNGNVPLATVVSSDVGSFLTLKISSHTPPISEYVYKADCAEWKKGASSLSKTRLLLNSLDSLRYEGIYCYREKAWKRLYLSREGIEIRLVYFFPLLFL